MLTWPRRPTRQPEKRAGYSSWLYCLLRCMTTRLGPCSSTNPRSHSIRNFSFLLLREIHSISGDPTSEGKKLVVMATHSTELIELSPT